MSEYFEAEIRKRPEMFVPVLEKGWYANICYWYVPKRLRCRPHDTIWKAEIHKVAPALKEKMMFEGSLMITFQPHKGQPNFWRAIGKLIFIDWEAYSRDSLGSRKELVELIIFYKKVFEVRLRILSYVRIIS